MSLHLFGNLEVPFPLRSLSPMCFVQKTFDCDVDGYSRLPLLLTYSILFYISVKTQLPRSDVEILMPLQYVIIQHFESKRSPWVTCVDLGNVKQRSDVIPKGGDHRLLFLE